MVKTLRYLTTLAPFFVNIVSSLGVTKQYFLRSWLFILATTLAPVVMAAGLTVSVDRTVIAGHETLELTIRTETGTDGTPDLSSLEKDFEIINSHQNRQIRIINGRSESWHDWIITLAPRREGRLTIPALKLGNLSSAPIPIEVSSKKAMASGENVSPVFINSEVDKEIVYVQEEILLTLQILYRVNLYDDSRLTPLNIEGALVQQIGDTRKFETVVGGTRYGVFELKYAIHPQRTGPLEIPSQVFTGTMADRRDPFSSMFSFGGGKPVTARSADITLLVQPQPDKYSGPVWLPARNLTLTEAWSQPIDQIRVGDAVTRTITLEADGLSSAQLPAVRVTAPEGVNAYPDQSKTEDAATSRGIVGRRVEAIAMVPTRPGSIHLPAIRYSWYDTENNKERVEEIPARTIKVLPAEGTAIEAPAIKQPAVEKASPPPSDSLQREALVTPIESGSSWLWPAVSGFFALLWLITTFLFWRSRNQRSKPSASAAINHQTSDHEPAAFKALEEACKAGDTVLIKRAFIAWNQARYQDHSLATIDRCLRACDSTELENLFAALDAAVYSKDKSDIPSDKILETCKALRKKNRNKSADSSLPGLYPT